MLLVPFVSPSTQIQAESWDMSQKEKYMIFYATLKLLLHSGLLQMTA